MQLEELQQWIKENLFDTKNRINSRRTCNNAEWIKKHYLNEYTQILKLTSFLNSKTTIRQRLYHIYNNMLDLSKCEVCGNPTTFYNFNVGYKRFCSLQCRTKGTEEKRRNTCIDKYGSEWAIQSKEIIKKRKETCLKKYNVEQYCQTEEYKNIVKTKRKNETQEQKNLRDERHRMSCISNHGKGNQTNSIKRKETWVKTYGVRHPMHVPEIAEKTMGSYKNSWHDYILPSGKEIKLQGYEPEILDKLLQQYNENEILYKKSDMPEIWYQTPDNKKHRYYPDFYIPKDNLIIEVKSTYTYQKYKEINLLKEESTKDLGYNYDLIIYK